ncbi:hypothetical protein [Halopseudomonas laoshanensis]
MQLMSDHHAITRSASRTGSVCALTAMVGGYFYFGYWFSRMRA